MQNVRVTKVLNITKALLVCDAHKKTTHSHKHTYLQIHKIMITPKQHTHTLQYTHTHAEIYT